MNLPEWKRLIGWLLLLPLGVVVIIVGFRLWNGEMSEREALHQARVREVLAVSKAWQAQVDSLRARERAALARADTAAAAIDRARPELASLRASFVLEPPSASGVAERLVDALEVQLSRLEVEVKELRVAYQAASARADAAEARVHVLEPLLQEAEKLRRCRIAGLIPCPSRQVSFLAGAGVATVVILTTVSKH